MIDTLKTNAPISTRIVYLSSALSPATDGGDLGFVFRALRCCLAPVLGSLLALGAFFQGIQAVHMLHILGF